MTSERPSAQSLETVQKWLKGRLASTLRVEESTIESTATFTELGVSSIRAVELVAEIEDEFGVDLPSTLIYDYPTVDAVAPYVAALVDDAAS